MSLSDTHPAIAAKLVKLIQGLSLERKLELTSSFSWDLIQASRNLIADEHPEWTDLDVKLHWAKIHYGADLAGPRAALPRRPMSSEIVAALLPLTHVFGTLDIQYRVGGSVAISVFGMMRATYDIDLVANVRTEHVESLVTMLSADYYIDAELIRHDLEHSSSSNLIYLASMMKIDIFILGSGDYDQTAFSRAITRSLSADDATGFVLSTPEDVILRKLDWHRRVGAASDRQLEDIVHVLRIRAGSLDREYLDA